MKEKKKIVILGSTGSIGKNTLDVIRHLKDDFCVEALAARANIDVLAEQIKEFSPSIVAVYDEEKIAGLRALFPHLKIVGGMQGLEEVASLDGIDTVLSAITGAIGIMPTAAAIRKGHRIALANKEVLVAAGEHIKALALASGAEIIPVDSEHSAIFQCIAHSDKNALARIILTASGGPFYKVAKEKRCAITKEMALKHPTWTMGAKITIDSSTLMNKGLEVIEASYLFDLPRDKIDVVIHPQSVIHSMVEFCDGSMLSQMSIPTMHVPIQYALTYPKRLPGLLKPFDFSKYSSLEFVPYEKGEFDCLDLAYFALEQGGSMPCYLNAANEVLVDRFLQNKIRWIDISLGLKQLCFSHKVDRSMTLSKVFEIDAMAREEAHKIQFNEKVFSYDL